ncbi:hypothetical protein AB833_17145 [Chromatiales bacterium (ex Bugula neritina AB1)]|nr:hypothetical protein AB833_17145 [Chromatiales bacterium (ex Bugula neritina AB1)]
MTRLLYSLAITALISGCATVPYTEKVLAEGGTVIKGDFADLVGESGTTAISVNGDWWGFYGPGGRKVIHVAPLNETAELSWRVNESGEFCEIEFRSREEKCFGEEYQLIKTKDGLYSRTKNGKKGEYPFRIEEGNTKNL